MQAIATLITLLFLVTAEPLALCAQAQSVLDGGVTPLMRAVRDGDSDDLDDLLANGVSLAAQDAYGYTALHFAAIRGDAKVAKRLLAKGAPLNVGDNDGTTALMVAASWDRDNVVKCLIEAGADANVRDNKGNAAIDYAIINNKKGIVKLLSRTGFPSPLPASTPRQKSDDDDHSRPRPLNNPEAHYTELARQRRSEGDAMVRVWVGSDGVIQKTRVLIGLPFGLSAEAANAVQRVRFEPAIKDGKPTDATALVVVKFHFRRSNTGAPN